MVFEVEDRLVALDELEEGVDCTEVLVDLCNEELGTDDFELDKGLAVCEEMDGFVDLSDDDMLDAVRLDLDDDGELSTIVFDRDRLDAFVELNTVVDKTEEDVGPDVDAFVEVISALEEAVVIGDVVIERQEHPLETRDIGYWVR